MVLALSVVAVVCFTYLYHEKVFNWIGTQLEGPVIANESFLLTIGVALLSADGKRLYWSGRNESHDIKVWDVDDAKEILKMSDMRER